MSTSIFRVVNGIAINLVGEFPATQCPVMLCRYSDSLAAFKCQIPINCKLLLNVNSCEEQGHRKNSAKSGTSNATESRTQPTK